MLLSSIIKVVQALQYYLDPSPLDIVSNHTFQSHGSRSTHSATEITHAHALICTSSDISSLHTISCVMNMSTCASIVVVGVDAFIGNQCQPSPSHTNSPLTRICLFAPIFIWCMCSHCWEYTRIPIYLRSEKTYRKIIHIQCNYTTQKIIWFINLSTSIELQWFTIYKGNYKM